ncbi:MAG: hypothetical protein WC869_15765 [Phycisphaerae bacterium]
MDVSRREFFRELIGRKSLVRLCSAASDSLENLGLSIVPRSGPEEAGLALAKAATRRVPVAPVLKANLQSEHEAPDASLPVSTSESQ